ncbi:hypothetical protein QE385_002551 [Sphingomonas sp. SORGH_AS 950]|uniref:hypothetical protein n=1 Tax=Sphingomonas sp. SORGH_AS_0950 TaxID=3041792 RepID=UPI002781B6C9|nr:hypothetical protein [Sphingomonas sp. SORGH_AS_0950]MDQ1158224.1 hypothetical protein [Sphingomonas sp. SORGH_AS_0950]
MMSGTMEPLPAATVTAAAGAVRALLRLDEGNEAALVERVAGVALGLAESFCGQLLIARVVEEPVTASVAWQALSATPVGAILSEGEGAIDRDGRGWVRTGAAITVRYRAGLAADWTGLPPEIAHGVAIMGAHLFDNREAAAVPPAAVAALWRPWRRMRLDTPRRS